MQEFRPDLWNKVIKHWVSKMLALKSNGIVFHINIVLSVLKWSSNKIIFMVSGQKDIYSV